MRSMTPTEAAQYLTYWQNMEAPVQVGPGWTSRLVDVVPSSQPGRGIYTRITYYDNFGRMVGRTDVGHHGRPHVHPVPHRHDDPMVPPSQMPSGGIRVPGSDPPTGVWPGSIHWSRRQYSCDPECPLIHHCSEDPSNRIYCSFDHRLLIGC
jgi:hypothetical protein